MVSLVRSPTYQPQKTPADAIIFSSSMFSESTFARAHDLTMDMDHPIR